MLMSHTNNHCMRASSALMNPTPSRRENIVNKHKATRLTMTLPRGQQLGSGSSKVCAAFSRRCRRARTSSSRSKDNIMLAVTSAGLGIMD